MLKWKTVLSGKTGKSWLDVLSLIVIYNHSRNKLVGRDSIKAVIFWLTVTDVSVFGQSGNFIL